MKSNFLHEVIFDFYLSLLRKFIWQTLLKALDISSALAQVASDLLKALLTGMVGLAVHLSATLLNTGTTNENQKSKISKTRFFETHIKELS